LPSGGGIMHINRTFSLKLATVERLNDSVRAKLRSKFVDRAIQDRLNPSDIQVELLGDRRIMLILLSRDISEPTKRALALELGIDVEAYL
jgi:hypothetical protein